MIRENNQAVFEAFLDFPKPLLVAANGPAIGACVPSASLCDAIVASDKDPAITSAHHIGGSCVLGGISNFQSLKFDRKCQILVKKDQNLDKRAKSRR